MISDIHLSVGPNAVHSIGNQTIEASVDDTLTDLPVGSLRPSRYLATAAPWNRVAACILLLPALPVLLVFAVAIRITSSGPVIYRQRRVGLRGREFYVCKLRTMRQDAETLSGPVWAQRQDPRVTPLGRLLRKLHIDELPQLWNVLKGEMAIIGPRPERPEFVCVLSREIPGYLERLSVLPGITGLAQILLPPDSDIVGVRRKLRQDITYIENAGLWLDARIFLSTTLRICGIPGGLAGRLFGFRLNDSDADSSPTELAFARINAVRAAVHLRGDALSSPSKPKPR